MLRGEIVLPTTVRCIARAVYRKPMIGIAVMSAITTHVLDTSRGRPAAGCRVVLEARDGAGALASVGRGATDADGRLRTLMSGGEPLAAGVYRLIFDTSSYFAADGVRAFFPRRDCRIRPRGR